MEKTIKYQNSIIELLNSYNENGASTNAYILTDTHHHHYQWLRVGWDSKENYYFRVRIHLHINAEGKICILENRTEEDVAEDLVAKGVSKKDIVLSFLPQSARQDSEYALA